jgi:ketosteroid isomerase-like protein
MRAAPLTLIVLTLGALPHAVRAQPPRASSNDEQALRRASHAWAQAVVRRDTATIARLLADEFFAVAPRGTRTKAETLDAVAHGGAAPLEASDDGIQSVRVYGTTGVIRGVASRIVRDSTGARRTQRSNFLEVFVRRDGRWQAVAGHYFPVADDR